MSRQVLLIQGAGDVGYEGDIALIAPLPTALGTFYKVYHPVIPTDEKP